MTSTIKVNNVQNQCGTNIIKRCGTTTTVGSGASNPIVVCGSTVTIGRCGGTVALASGATQTGFGRTGTVDWQTTPKTATFTAVNGEGYFINSGSAITANLPAGTAGDIISFSDYARNFATYNFSVSPNGSEKIGGIAADTILDVNGQAATFVYVDSTKGWVNIQNAEDTQTGISYITATGGTITNTPTCKIHTFTGPGTFTVCTVGSCGANNIVSYMVIAGGGGGGCAGGGGGGAGGFREVKSPITPYTASPLDGYSTPANRVTVSATAYPIDVGGGGAGGTPGAPATGTSGLNSTALGITSAGGGGGGSRSGTPGLTPQTSSGRTGGSGGGGGGGSPQPDPPGGVGNTPPTSPPQGQNGGSGKSSGNHQGGGGGGAGGTGTAGNCSPDKGGPGGAGTTTEINASPVTRAGGGGGGNQGPSAGCGTAGGGNGGLPGADATPGTCNTGGGGGGAGFRPSQASGNGGSGLVIIRYKYQ